MGLSKESKAPIHQSWSRFQRVMFFAKRKKTLISAALILCLYVYFVNPRDLKKLDVSLSETTPIAEDMRLNDSLSLPSGEFLLIGEKHSDHSKSNPLFYKVSDGNIKRLNSGKLNIYSQIIKTPKGFALTRLNKGHIQNGIKVIVNSTIILLDENLKVLKEVPCDMYRRCQISNLLNSDDGGIVACGTFYAAQEKRGQEIFIAKFDSLGILQWKQTVGGFSNEGNSINEPLISKCKFGGYFLAYQSASKKYGAKNSWRLCVAHISEKGENLFEKPISSSQGEQVHKILFINEDGLVVYNGNRTASGTNQLFDLAESAGLFDFDVETGVTLRVIDKTGAITRDHFLKTGSTHHQESFVQSKEKFIYFRIGLLLQFNKNLKPIGMGKYPFIKGSIHLSEIESHNELNLIINSYTGEVGYKKLKWN